MTCRAVGRSERGVAVVIKGLDEVKVFLLFLPKSGGGGGGAIAPLPPGYDGPGCDGPLHVCHVDVVD